MTGHSASWAIVVLALCAANLPFINERCFALVALRRFSTFKPFWFRLLELIALYFLVGVAAAVLENSIGNRFDQSWEFYAVTGALFLVLAFPGFVFRYLLRHHE